jgi:hypothetical protein
VTRPLHLVYAGLFVGGIAFTVAASAPQRRARLPELGLKRAGAGTLLGGRASSFTLHGARGTVTLRSGDEPVGRDIALFVVVNGNARPLSIGRQDLHASEKGSFGAAITVPVGGEEAGALFDLHVDSDSDALVADLHMVPRGPLASAHTLALRMETEAGGNTAFVSGIGNLGDLGTTTGGIVVLDASPRPLGFASARGPLGVALVADDGGKDPLGPMRLSVTSDEATFDGTKEASVGLRVVLGASSGAVWRGLFAATETPVAHVRGIVTGTTERAQVFGLDAEGAPRVRVRAEPGGRFDVDVPTTVTQWYAALDATRTSAPITYTPGLPWELRLDVSPGGELALRVTDGDTGAPITARVIVHGIDGTLDPSFGPDYRASGAGPIVDSLRGEITTPLPAGRYRVAATKGIEWSIDAKTVEITGGHSASTELALRHVVPTPATVGCDLHVHARPSFDAPVSAEDRVLSLVAAGIDFAVPSEHNLVGDYGPALEAQDLGSKLAWVHGVEVTTFNPRYGHFGVFPYPPGPAPPYRGTSVGAIFAAARRGDPNRVLVVHHPRLPQAIGYFEIFGWTPQSETLPPRMRTDFDAIEVYNGYDAARPYRVDAVLEDFYTLLNMGHRYAATGSSDSHRIQFTWAGYPRTMVRVSEVAAGDTGAPIDTAAIVAAVKKGHATVTSGPIIEMEMRGARPGDEIETSDELVPAHVTIRAAPWVDVTSLQVVVGGREVQKAMIPSRPTVLGAEAGSLDEAQARTIRFDGQISVPVGPDSSWVMLVVRGARAMDDILPFMPVPPMAFTNPIWITRPGRPLPKR